ncbi:MAG: hypothetical protein ACRDMH_02485 [Solirubrobacterales bacterium]
MRRIRSRLTYANVISTLALFSVLAGGSALAAVVITSNSQVGKDTISGHKPPGGKHANIIGGSINGQDVANGSLTPTDARNTVTQATGSATVPVGASSEFGSIPLAHNTFTQGAQETDWVFGRITDDRRDCGANGVVVYVYAQPGGVNPNGVITSANLGDSPIGSNLSGIPPGQLVPSGHDRQVRLTAKWEAGGNTCADSVHLSLALYVVALR